MPLTPTFAFILFLFVAQAVGGDVRVPVEIKYLFEGIVALLLIVVWYMVRQWIRHVDEDQRLLREEIANMRDRFDNSLENIRKEVFEIHKDIKPGE